MEIKIMMKPDIGKEDVLEASKVLVGGFTKEGNFPFGAFMGDLNMFELPVVVEHMMRAVIKIMREEQKLSDEVIKTLFDFALEQAWKVESENDPENNIDLKTHELRMRNEKH